MFVNNKESKIYTQIITGYQYLDEYNNKQIEILDFTDDDEWDDVFIDTKDFLFENLDEPDIDEYMYFLAKINGEIIEQTGIDVTEYCVELRLIEANYSSIKSK